MHTLRRRDSSNFEQGTATLTYLSRPKLDARDNEIDALSFLEMECQVDGQETTLSNVENIRN